MATIGKIGNNTSRWIRETFTNRLNSWSSQLGLVDIAKYGKYLCVIDNEIPAYLGTISVTELPIGAATGQPWVRRSTDILFRDGTYEMRVVSLKGEIFYMGKGLLFDSSFNPYLIGVYKADNISNGNNVININKVKMYVNPKVLLHPQYTINKYILQQVIPYLLSNNISRIAKLSDYTLTTDKCEVIISNEIYKFIKSPKALNEDLYEKKSELKQIILQNFEKLKL